MNHKVKPLDAFADWWYCVCGQTFESGSGFAICPRDFDQLLFNSIVRDSRLTVEERSTKLITQREMKQAAHEPIPDWYEWAAEDATWK